MNKVGFNDIKDSVVVYFSSLTREVFMDEVITQKLWLFAYIEDKCSRAFPKVLKYDLRKKKRKGGVRFTSYMSYPLYVLKKLKLYDEKKSI